MKRVQFMLGFNFTVVLVLLLIRTVGVSSKDLKEKERATRASFIQSLLNKQKNLEGRIRLIGGRNKFEGKFFLIILL